MNDTSNIMMIKNQYQCHKITHTFMSILYNFPLKNVFNIKSGNWYNEWDSSLRFNELVVVVGFILEMFDHKKLQLATNAADFDFD